MPVLDMDPGSGVGWLGGNLISPHTCAKQFFFKSLDKETKIILLNHKLNLKPNI